MASTCLVRIIYFDVYMKYIIYFKYIIETSLFYRYDIKCKATTLVLFLEEIEKNIINFVFNFFLYLTLALMCNIDWIAGLEDTHFVFLKKDKTENLDLEEAVDRYKNWKVNEKTPLRMQVLSYECKDDKVILICRWHCTYMYPLWRDQ